MKKIITIDGMSCNNCVMHVTNALKEVKGVENIKVILEEKKAYVDVLDEVTNEELINAITDAGYDVMKIE